MNATSKTCGTCDHAEPSKTIPGMVHCKQNFGTSMRSFSYLVTNLPPNRPACNAHLPRKGELVLSDQVLQASEPLEENDEIEQTTPAVARPPAPQAPLKKESPIPPRKTHVFL